MMTYRIILALAAASAAVKALPLPAPQSGDGSACDTSCLAVYNAANSCLTLPAAAQGSCLCEIPGFLTNAQACVSCSGGNVFTASGLSAVTRAATYCASLDSVVTSSASSATATSTATGVASDVAIPVTESAGSNITIQAWAPSGFETEAEYQIEATGGLNTTIIAVQTSTYFDATETTTLTQTAAFVLGPSTVAQFQGIDGYDDVTICTLEAGSGSNNETVADCVKVDYAGETITAATEFTLTGAITDWVAVAAPPTTSGSGATLGTIATSPTAVPAVSSRPTATFGSGLSL